MKHLKFDIIIRFCSKQFSDYISYCWYNRYNSS